MKKEIKNRIEEQELEEVAGGHYGGVFRATCPFCGDVYSYSKFSIYTENQCLPKDKSKHEVYYKSGCFIFVMVDEEGEHSQSVQCESIGG